MNARELRATRASLLDAAKTMTERAERETRDLNPSENAQFTAIMAQAEQLGEEIEELEGLYPRRQLSRGVSRDHSFLNSSTRRGGIMGDSETRALAAFVRGDRAGLRDLEAGEDGYDAKIELRAVDSTMNIATPADGGNVVPTGFSGLISRRMNEISLAERLGVLPVPGKGTTVEFPYEAADPAVLATTAEQNDAHENNYERDAPVINSKSFTLIKKTKKIELTEEIMADEDANLMAFIGDWIGRAIAMTRNAMLLTEVAAYGTALKTFASATSIADGEVEDIVFNDTLSYYLDDGGSIGWVMRPATYGAIKKISGDPRLYGDPMPDSKRNLLEYPVFFSASASAMTATGKSVYFGNWYSGVGMRLAPALSMIRDPYSKDGLVILRFMFRACFGILQAGAVGFGVHPSS